MANEYTIDAQGKTRKRLALHLLRPLIEEYLDYCDEHDEGPFFDYLSIDFESICSDLRDGVTLFMIDVFASGQTVFHHGTAFDPVDEIKSARFERITNHTWRVIITTNNTKG